MKPELWRWSATDLARAIASGEISSHEAVQSTLDRIAEVNPALNAIVEVLAEEALAAADVADAAVKAGYRLGPLHGVPVAADPGGAIPPQPFAAADLDPASGCADADDRSQVSGRTL